METGEEILFDCCCLLLTEEEVLVGARGSCRGVCLLKAVCSNRSRATEGERAEFEGFSEAFSNLEEAGDRTASVGGGGWACVGSWRRR